MRSLRRSLLSSFALTLVACGQSTPRIDGGVDGGGDGGPRTDGGAVCGGPHVQQSALASLTLPQTSSQFAWDLVGDGAPANQLGAIFQVLASQGANPQSAVDLAIDAGALVDLLDLHSSDPAFQAEACAVSHWYPGLIDGGARQVNPAGSAGTFTGSLVAGAFDSGTTTLPPDVTLTLPLVAFGGSLLALPLHGGHLLFTQDAGVLSGQLNGAILKRDIDLLVIPDVAAGLNARVHVSPCDSTCVIVKGLFDVGNGVDGGSCTWVDGTVGVAGDGNIASCEVGDNSLVAAVFAPDVQLFDGGVYAPNPANTTPDSLSVGVGFTAQPATF